MVEQNGNPRRPTSRLPRLKAVFAASVLLSLAVTAQASAAPSAPAKPVTPALFISSDPMGAVVVFDGKTLSSRTPLLLRDIPAGRHRIEIARKGYLPYLGTLAAAAGKPTAFNVDLAAQYVEPLFSAGGAVVIDGKKADFGKERYRLPNGDYRLSESSGVTSVQQLYPAGQLLRVVDLATGVLVTVSAILAGEAILDSTTTNTPANVSGYLPVWILGGISALSDLSLHIQRSRYLAAYRATAIPLARTSRDARRLYQQGQSLLAAGKLSGATASYIEIIRGGSDSLYYPRALYQLAKIEAIEGDNLLATAELRIILDKYPLADLYDRTCKSLADISYREGDYKAALAYLDKMVFLDPLYTRAQIADYRAIIERRLSQETGS